MVNYAFVYADGLIVNMGRLLAMTSEQAAEGAPRRVLHFEDGRQIAITEAQGKALEDAVRTLGREPLRETEVTLLA